MLVPIVATAALTVPVLAGLGDAPLVRFSLTKVC